MNERVQALDNKYNLGLDYVVNNFLFMRGQLRMKKGGG